MDQLKQLGEAALIGLACFLAYILIFVVLLGGPLLLIKHQAPVATQLPLVAITGVMALLASLALVSVTFSLAGLSDRTQALALPEGSVRAVIALSLIVIFAIASFFFYSSLASSGLQKTEAMTEAAAQAFQRNLRAGEVVGTVPTGTSETPVAVVYRVGSQAAEDFAKQVFTLIGTLMTAVSSFYFATQAMAASQPKTQPSTPRITEISPSTGSRGTTIESVQIMGTGLLLVQSVKLVHGATEVTGTDVTSSDQVVKCKFVLGSDLPQGSYDVVAMTSDNKTARFPAAFKVQ